MFSSHFFLSIAHRSVATIGLSSTSRRTLLAGAVLGAIALIVIVAVISAICIAFIYYHVKPHRHSKFSLIIELMSKSLILNFINFGF